MLRLTTTKFARTAATYRSGTLPAMVLQGLLVPWVALAAPAQPANPPPAAHGSGSISSSQKDAAPTQDAAADEEIEVVGTAPLGAQALIPAEILELQEHDDLHKVLARVPGVYVREEDGYGLRPNIGMRGAPAERSAKITIMEDGVLSGPAPYSAPAAYYVPLLTRMSGVEVVKGPSAILYGPATVGGAINMKSHELAWRSGGYLDLAWGTDNYVKLHGRSAWAWSRLTVGAEALRVASQGFKRLDGGGDTGFAKHDVSLSARWVHDPSDSHAAEWLGRVGYGDEVSNETYTGLTDADFAMSPQRRYRATVDDQMDWTHWRLRMTVKKRLSDRFRVVADGYYHRFHRTWGKVDGFVGQRDLAAVLAKPQSGANEIYYQVLTGQQDSGAPEEELIRGINDRAFNAAGLQAALAGEFDTGPLSHLVDAGVRLHFDRAKRRRDEAGFLMQTGALVRSQRASRVASNSRAETTALAAHLQDQVVRGRWRLSAGGRLEQLFTRFADRLTATHRDAATTELMVGGGAEFTAYPGLTTFVGIYQGFVPSPPSLEGSAPAERSVNGEAGARWRGESSHADLLGFVSDYKNLNGDCTLSSGCQVGMEDQAFSGGRVRALGIEASAGAEVRWRGWRFPLYAAYTLSHAAFRSNFSSAFPGWGEVEKGDELPYLARHQLMSEASLAKGPWDVRAALQWRSSMRDVAGVGDAPLGVAIPSLATVETALRYRLSAMAQFYGTCSNVTNSQRVVSRRPYGVRPSAPRLCAVGYKAEF